MRIGVTTEGHNIEYGDDAVRTALGTDLTPLTQFLRTDGARFVFVNGGWIQTHAPGGLMLTQSPTALIDDAGANLTATVAGQFQTCGTIKSHRIDLPTDAERIRVKPGKSTDSPSITNTIGTLVKGTKGLDFALGTDDEGFWFIRDAGMAADVTFNWTPGRV